MGTKAQFLAVALLGYLAYVNGKKIECVSLSPESRSVYDFNATNVYENETVSLSRYRGMNAFMTKFSSLGFTGLGFPCNSFELLEPYDTYTELLNGLKYVRPGGGFVPNFPMFKKIDVNGKNEHPLYTYLKSECGPTSEDFEDGLFYSPLAVHDVRWNYEVFVINQRGLPEFRYSPDHSMDDIEIDIKALLKRNQIELINQRPIVESQEIIQSPATEDLNGVPEEEFYYPDLDLPQTETA